MNYFDTISLAFSSIGGNKLRTFLTIMIIAIGIMALVSILTAVDCLQGTINNNFATMGANNFDIRKKGTGVQFGRFGRKNKIYQSITYQQAQKFKDKFKYPATISISTICNIATTIKYQSQKTNPNIRVLAGDENYLTIGGFEILSGRNFTPSEIQNGRNLAIISQVIAEKLFIVAERAVDKIISIDNKSYVVLAVLKTKGSSGIFTSDNLAIIPIINSWQNTNQTENATYVITVNVNNAFSLTPTIAEATGIMRTVRGLKYNEEEDFDIQKSDKLSGILIDQSSYITSAATIIGFITLLGGAIGLMNIMLVSVAERTREIGINKAIGANNIFIRRQFLAEAIIICQIGGIVGVILGVLSGNLVSLFLQGPFIIPWKWIFGGSFLCLSVGVIAGIYPAIKASKVSPIESLRYE